jgi:hypothetical protein
LLAKSTPPFPFTLSTPRGYLLNKFMIFLFFCFALQPAYRYSAALPVMRDGHPFTLPVGESVRPVHAVAALGDVFPRFSAFWDEMDDLDASAVVLEPERPTRDAVLRRVVVTTRCVRSETLVF